MNGRCRGSGASTLVTQTRRLGVQHCYRLSSATASLAGPSPRHQPELHISVKHRIVSASQTRSCSRSLPGLLFDLPKSATCYAGMLRSLPIISSPYTSFSARKARRAFSSLRKRHRGVPLGTLRAPSRHRPRRSLSLRQHEGHTTFTRRELRTGPSPPTPSSLLDEVQSSALPTW